MNSPKRTREDLDLNELLTSTTAWVLRVRGENRALHLIRPPHDSPTSHLQWILVEPANRGWYPGPDLLLVDDRREFILVVEAKRQDSANHAATRKTAFAEALGYAQLFDSLRQVESAGIWVGTQEKRYSLLDVLQMSAVNIRTAVVVPTLLALGSKRGPGLQLALFLATRLRVKEPIVLPKKAPRWQRRIATETWNAAIHKYRTWAYAECSKPYTTQTSFECLEETSGKA